MLVAAIATHGLILIPIAIGVVGWIWYRREQPDSIAGRIITQAVLADPAVAVHMLNQAIEADPHGVKTLRACATWFYDNHCWQDAAEAYAGLLTIESDFEAENRYITCLLAVHRADDAIPRLEHIRATMPTLETVQTATLGPLATAYLYKGDLGQAMAFISLAPLQKHNLDAVLQGCLYLRAVIRYMTGDRRRAISDLERLYAVNSSMAGVVEDKQAMEAGTFEVAKPKPYPDWYPIDQRVAVLASDPRIDEPGAFASPPEPPMGT